MARSNRAGGPRTDQGKLVSSRNAIKTGSYSSLIILPGESEEDFRLLEEQFFQDFSPQDVAQATMVRSLAIITWKKLRAEKIEHASIIHELNEPFDLFDFHNLILPLGSHKPEILLGYVTRLTVADIDSWLFMVKFAEKFSQSGANTNELQALEEGAPFLYQFYQEQGQIMKLRQNNPAYWADAELQDGEGRAHGFVKYVANNFLKKYELEVWAIKHIDVLKAAVASIKEQRLLRFMQNKNLQRVHDDLDRAFNRTLNELRNHKKWCRDESAIDVTDAEE